MKPRILVIDDNPDIAQALKVMFLLHNIDCEYSDSPSAAMTVLSRQRFDLVIQDMNFTTDMTSGEEGIKLFRDIRELHGDLPIILMTAWTQLETAIELVKQGASDYIAKPWDDDKLMVTVNNLLELSELQRAQRSTVAKQTQKRQALAKQFDLCGLRYHSEEMFNLLQMATQVAPAPLNILITGPNGAGKEKIAEIVQANSSCRQGPFIKVNVGALSPELMAAELFGAEAGAYTGSTKLRKGRFELADNGTLFLDEIGNLSLDGQSKLLRVLETGEFERVGGSETLEVNVRVISATNTDLKQAIESGQFREDLFYRLNVIELALKPLCQRKADIIPLAELFLSEPLKLSEQASQVLIDYHWPGNIRELKNVMQRASLLAKGDVIDDRELGLPVSISQRSVTDEVGEISQQEIESAIERAGGVISEAAKQLGLSRSALYRRMKKFGIN